MIQVTKEEFERDLENTQNESRAYALLAEGYEILGDLPENAGPTAAGHKFKASAFRGRLIECNDFLAKLEAYGKENF